MKSASENALEISSRKEHWDQFYRDDNAPAYPSQFAVFVCDYLEQRQNIVEFGCGLGRDALFFSSMGFRTIGFDASQEAIKSCTRKSTQRGFDHSTFRQLSIKTEIDATEVDNVGTEIRDFIDASVPTMVYARFFVHAITPDEESSFFRILKFLQSLNVMCAFEFRTHRDQPQEKITSPHYRRFINPVSFLERIGPIGFHVDYQVEGFGYAKYQSEDAHVARVMLRSGSTTED